MVPNHNSADPLLGLRAILDGVSAQESAILASIATSAVQQAQAYRLLPQPEKVNSGYTPHPLDVLIFAAIADGALQRAEMLAALSKDKYKSRSSTLKVTGTALKNRLPELVLAGALSKTPAGYAIANRDAIQIAEDSFRS